MTNNRRRKILVTSALPYANGSIHIGHLVEYIQTDIFVRFLRHIGEDAIYMCADDTHGTPIFLKARSLNITPEELIARYNIEHQKDFGDFHILFDHYYTTHSPENEKHSKRIFEKLTKGGHIFTADVEQFYCEEDSMFLSDRFIKGTCPNGNCKAKDQYGDVCEVCGMHYDPTDLFDPRCATCGKTPVRRKSRHYFFRLIDFEDRLRTWFSGGSALQPETYNSIKEWLDKGLKDWDISRDAPYFGFRIPNEPDKFFYVWLDAPIGYVATTEHYCKVSGKDFDEYWFNPETEIYHFIGKDIVYFHTLFWPAMLMGSDYNVPRSVYVHGFLTVNGEKMSKTRGTFITARTYLDNLDPQYLRYYYSTKLSSNSDDIDMNLEDFRFRVNADLVNNIVNIGSRSVTMLVNNFHGKIGSMNSETASIFKEFTDKMDSIKSHYMEREFSKVTRTVTEISDRTNKYFSDNEPWKIISENPAQAHETCTFSLNVFKFICTILKPILPKMAAEVETMLDIPDQKWDEAKITLPNDHKIHEFKHLMSRVEKKSIDKMILSSREELQRKAEPKKSVAPVVAEKQQKTVSFEEFAKLDLCVGQILSVEEIPNSKTLYRLKVDIGKIITLIAGIKTSYPNLESLKGKKIVVVANLEPKVFKGIGVSEGMLLAAASPDGNAILLELANEAECGWKVL
jgi:methionyl-tRNA synthetase